MIDSKTSDKKLIAETLLYYNKTAVLELSWGNYPKALELFREGYIIENELALHQQKAQSLVNISNTELLLGESEQALASAEEAVEIFDRLNCRSDYLRALLLTGVIHAHRQEYKNAVCNLEEVVRKADTDDLKGEAYLALHQLYLTEQNRQKAQDAVTKAIQFFERSGKIDRLKLALGKRAAFFRDLKKNNLAAIDFNRLQSLDEEMKM